MAGWTPAGWSCINRFGKVCMAGLSSADYRLIPGAMFPKLLSHLITKMVSFNERLERAVVVEKVWFTLGVQPA